MSHSKQVEKAIQWLRDQQESLKRLRNASTRDPEFKEWRQATLTYVQRIWPGDARRSGRFRRVPFTPPSSRADRNEMRLAYEKGFSEAMKLLDLFVEDLELNGIEENGGDGRPPSLSSMSEADDDFPTLELPGDGDDEAADEEESESEPEPREAKKNKRNGRKKGAKTRLKEMLGFGDPGAASDPEEEGQKPPSVEEVTAADDDEPEEEGLPPELEITEPVAAAADEVDLPEDAPGASPAHPDAEEDEKQDFGAFLNSSPIFQAASRAHRPAPPAKAVEGQSKSAPADSAPRFETAGALAVAALAGDLERLGIPASDRKRIATALFELAGLIDAGDPSWDGLRSAIDWAMAHPAIARRLVPMLIPYLDRAA